ncbi:hypothetical protein Forpe1208_v015525 [Fusarium oxysporum f. sp. rapae]|uniref:DUF1996 domain-containing protein n=1 Tax=Fusarium oxysporum f. sp. rapae TaxID=485398 RepID=A0A8J5TQR4_FUSOX|nr:hypothetical protein Forpe1208_v015525 [Fusarium oxysporum f. sp. rapae]
MKLSCGPAWCAHGDFISGWTEEAAENMVATPKDKHQFFPVHGALGGFNSGPTCQATHTDPSHGVNGYTESVAAMSKRDISWR